MQFMEFAGSLINVATIREVTLRYVGNDVETLVWLHGSPEPRVEQGNKLREVHREISPVIPASPGWEVLWHYPQDGGGDLVAREQVIGWRVQGDWGVVPVTADWSHNQDIGLDLDEHPNRHTHYLKRPNGTVDHAGYEGWENEADWLATMRGGGSKGTVRMFKIPASDPEAS
jgi:hypothetical protein